MWRLAACAFDGVHLLCFQVGGKAVHLNLKLLNGLILTDDGLVKAFHKLIQVGEVGLDIYQSFFMRHNDRLPQAGLGIDHRERAKAHSD